VLRRAFGRISDDKRIQAVIVAFCFGALIEGLAGFGTPVAITSVMLMALGFNPMKAAILALIGNTAPVAFGSIATPIITLAETTQLPKDDLGAMVGRQTPLLALIVPLILIYVVDGRRGLRQAWLPGAAHGLRLRVRAVHRVQLRVRGADGHHRLAAVGRLPRRLPALLDAGRAAARDPDGDGGRRGGPRRPAMAGAATHDVRHEAESARRDREGGDSPKEIVEAFAPVPDHHRVFALAQLPAIKEQLDSVSREFQWPGMDIRNTAGEPVSSATFRFNWLIAPGTLALICGVLTAIVLRLSPARALKAYADTLRQLLPAIITVMAVLALAYVMNQSGQTLTIGNWAAGAGGFFAFLSSIIGWLGVAVTGSDTSANALFGALQVTAAKESGLDAVLMASANSSGGVLGKMISPQNLAIGAAAVGLAGQEGDILRKVLGWSLVLLLFMCVLVYLQSTSVLGWMVP
jgi:lactate permease